MKIDDDVTIKFEGCCDRNGKITAIESFNAKKMYLIILEDYPIGIWFFDDSNIIKKNI
ncbi:hypothetical protein CRV12_00995 [Candidatus Pantoea edessiphila]|uniref:Protein DsrB n=1 Tax=Candidatus Pantoea edessiphila TaxID=2044610 RepID=A0A2P5T0W3_9GAMM|nr:hypothetical protein [Candidatus Pantoea edessiphila]PPI88200.1 hypothetical protein CRV12_00995 [Candidatus Pantoea edessiphila]